MGGYQQAGVGVTQAVEVYRREVMSSQKPPEPCCHIVWIHRCAVPLGEKQVVFYALSLDLHPAHPLGADFEPFCLLVLAVFLQELHAVRPDFHTPPGALCLWGIEHRTFARDVLQGAFY